MQFNESLENLLLILDKLGLEEKISKINEIKIRLHTISPFAGEPVDCVLWEKNTEVIANEYNPNKVATPEMELLEISILNDGYTQPIVSYYNENKYEIVDWFHRSRVGKESKTVNKRVMWYLPVVKINEWQSSKNDRIASTIRHNRARGKHQVDAMSEIVLELKNRNWTNERIARELWMDQDEILRLCQITGLQSLFQNEEFSKSWDADLSNENYEELDDVLEEEFIKEVRTANTSDPNRIFHTYDKWECHKHWLYSTTPPLWYNSEKAEQEYYNILSNIDLFDKLLLEITSNWKYSCEHHLTNTAMNRIAWLWQCAVCLHTWVPSKYRSWWNLLSEDQKEEANIKALEYLNKWLVINWLNELTMEEAISIDRQVEIY